jgi:hypothetical protein
MLGHGLGVRLELAPAGCHAAGPPPAACIPSLHPLPHFYPPSLPPSHPFTLPPSHPHFHPLTLPHTLCIHPASCRPPPGSSLIRGPSRFCRRPQRQTAPPAGPRTRVAPPGPPPGSPEPALRPPDCLCRTRIIKLPCGSVPRRSAVTVQHGTVTITAHMPYTAVYTCQAMPKVSDTSVLYSYYCTCLLYIQSGRRRLRLSTGVRLPPRARTMLGPLTMSGPVLQRQPRPTRPSRLLTSRGVRVKAACPPRVTRLTIRAGRSAPTRHPSTSEAQIFTPWIDP